MTFTLTTALREIVRADRMQPWHARQLTMDGFKLEQGLWVRRTQFPEQRFEHVSSVPRRASEPPEINGMESEKTA